MTQNIFLDSNILYSNPFFTETFGRLLLNLSEHKKIKLFISTVSLEETKNNYIKVISEKTDLIQKEWLKISKVSNSKSTLDLPKLEVYKQKFDNFYNEQIEKGSLTVIAYKNNILPELVHRSINRIKPFTEKNKSLEMQ
ncbi:PIN domain-containing protein [Ferruginibacter paludis]|uniref:PIN domain-containing protein n=1 Tax=Ferruginibacter paludis TaxID=1310417 RepID=UPI0025B285D5|nr:PIN domain-containing protein [Ferruginibacter paludis]MDN3655629.1 PIN domain-containing protein [Ferruginibacter paludis]